VSRWLDNRRDAAIDAVVGAIAVKLVPYTALVVVVGMVILPPWVIAVVAAVAWAFVKRPDARHALQPSREKKNTLFSRILKPDGGIRLAGSRV
jgi:predicted membrane-bound dolichyl-phosphate-mannose-protein mannosyltransferase